MHRRDFNRTLAAALVAALPGRAAERTYTISPQRLRASLEGLSQFGRNPEGGVSRVAWSKPDIEARRYVMEKLMTPAGLTIRVDPAGNIYGRRGGTERNV